MDSERNRVGVARAGIVHCQGCRTTLTHVCRRDRSRQVGRIDKCGRALRTIPRQDGPWNEIGSRDCEREIGAPGCGAGRQGRG